MREIREIWKDNVDSEFSLISRLVASPYCTYVCVDTEFPGFLHHTPFGASDQQRYRDVKLNVDSMKIIQLGFTFYNKEGQSSSLSWQINFKEFNPIVDPHATNSIQLLKHNGIDFEKNQRDGVDAMLFSRLLWQKLIFPCRHTTRWITFHGLYDLAYIVKLLTWLPLPNTLPEFLSLVKGLLGNVYDVKYMARFFGFDEKMGLMTIAQKLGINWEGRHHQAGHDSVLIGEVFWKIKEKFGIREDNFVGVVYGAERCDLVPMRALIPTQGCFAPQSYFLPVVSYPSQSHGFFR